MRIMASRGDWLEDLLKRVDDLNPTASPSAEEPTAEPAVLKPVPVDFYLASGARPKTEEPKQLAETKNGRKSSPASTTPKLPRDDNYRPSPLLGTTDPESAAVKAGWWTSPIVAAKAKIIPVSVEEDSNLVQIEIVESPSVAENDNNSPIGKS